METLWFNSMRFNRCLEYRCGLSKSIDSFGPIENNSGNEDPSILTDMDNTMNSDFYYLVDVGVVKTIVRILVIGMNMPTLLSDKTRDSNSFFIYDWNNIITSFIEGYILSQIKIKKKLMGDFYESTEQVDSDQKIGYTNIGVDQVENSHQKPTYIFQSGVNEKKCTTERGDRRASYIFENESDKSNSSDYDYNCNCDCDSEYNSDDYYYHDADRSQKASSDVKNDSDTKEKDPKGPSYILQNCNPSDQEPRYILTKIRNNDNGNGNDSDSTCDGGFPSRTPYGNEGPDMLGKTMEISGPETDSNRNSRSDSSSDNANYSDDDYGDDSNNLRKSGYIRYIYYYLEPQNFVDDPECKIKFEKAQNSTEIERTGRIPNNYDYSHLWVACDSCYGNNYKRFFKSKMNICEYCGCHLKMSSSDRIELLVDPGTWNPMDEDMFSVDPIEWDSEDEPSENPFDPFDFEDEDEPSENRFEDEDEDEPSENRFEDEDEDEPSENDDYQNRLDSYQDRTGLLEAVQTGTGQVKGIPVAIGILDFEFMGGSMGSVVGEKLTRLIEYATNQRLPLFIVCASGGARMQEGSLSLTQMAKISSALGDYTNERLLYVPILTTPTTGGVTASFGMLGDVILAEPDAYIAFAGKRVIEETLKIEVPEGSQSAEFLFEKGAFDSLVPRDYLKEVLSELLHFHGYFPLTQTEK
uniref:acetyl-CoA carboxylase carboxyltransferase beta subunit n=1 Tax=Medicago doliata TaxID=70944 RepID=UPI00226CCEED|nr:acetyl-CoA carboxylase carboxyltransferase beta subunit [Medicago doliata]UZC32510.1 acetyl-CoA carboxylase carboxyltransferase beta subunit [Medicago doliata]